MAPIHLGLEKLLDQAGIEYEIFHHRQDFRAKTTAQDTGTPAPEFAKTVLLRIDDYYALAVLPADHYVAPSRLARSLDADEVELATEAEMEDLMPDCEVGAAPPFGVLFALPTYVCPSLEQDEEITFNAGTHRDAVRMAWVDYERLAEPEVVPMSHHEEVAE